MSDRQARYRERNREKLRQKAAEYRITNPEEVKKAKDDYRKNNPEQVAKSDKTYKQTNKPQVNAKARERYEKNKQKDMLKPTEMPKFCSIDGEAHRETEHNSTYSFLRAYGLPPLIRRSGLTTLEIFEYLYRIPPGVIIVGFVLNYDWENWLKDIPDDAYKFLTGDMDMDIQPGDAAEWEVVTKTDKEGNTKILNNTILWEGYTISYFPKKIFALSKIGYTGKPWVRKILDVWGYCQSSFVKACIDWQVATQEEMAEIEEGKGKRDVFSWEELAYITKYNLWELEKMITLAENIFRGIDDACRIAELPIRPTGYDLYGPGAIARKLLKKTGWPNNLGRTGIPTKAMEDFLETIEQAVDQQKEYLKAFPIIASYYGGRIESACTGRFKKVYDYDLHSAYPSAVVRLPFFPGKMVWKKFLHYEGCMNWIKAKRPIGMVYVMWSFPKGWNWYPFPTRQKKYHNVFYPNNGQGWICTPELFAALDSIEDAEKYIKVYMTWTIPGKYGFGGGERPLPDNLKSETSKYIELMYKVRAAIKKQQPGGQLALKLILNSMYGKLLQQIGASLAKPGLFHDLVASWITSWTRAMIYRGIAPHRKGKTIVSIQTDGILTKKKLDLKLSPDLADWEFEELKDYRQLLPGLYDYNDGKGGRKVRRRGMPKTFEFEKAWETLHKPGEEYTVRFKTFLGRRLYLAQPYEYAGEIYQWPCMEKHFRPDLGAKRGKKAIPGQKHGDCYLQPGQKENWLPPKSNGMFGPGLPFVLKFEEANYIPVEDWEIENAKIQEHEDDSQMFFRE